MMTKAHRGKSGSTAATKTAFSQAGQKKPASTPLCGFVKYQTKKAPLTSTMKVQLGHK